MGSNIESIREILSGSFPVWVRTAAETVAVGLGEAIRFSDTLIFFPDCRVGLGGDIYLGNEKLEDVSVPLFIERDALIEDLLVHKPGAFVYPGNSIDFVSTWDNASPEQVKDCLWYALEDWFITFSQRVEFEISMNASELDDSPHSSWYSCYLGSFSEHLELRFRSVGWGRSP